MIYTKEQLKHLQSILLLMLIEFDRVCRENDLKYYLCGGTLLGAVRHKGFIPWDDDVDVLMPRDDYEKLLALKSGIFNDDMFIESNENDSYYGHVFAKLMLPGTLNSENFTENVKCKKNIYIDIFPLDYTTSNKFKTALQNKMCLLYSRLMLLNCNYKYEKKGIKKKYILVGIF